MPVLACWVVIGALAGALLACKPSPEDCRNLMPVDAGPAAPAQTPAGTRGCKAIQEGVTIQVEAVRRNLRWERGRIWIDGIETPESDLPSSMLAARARRAVGKGQKILQGIRDTARSLRDSFRNQEPPPKPPPPQP